MVATVEGKKRKKREKKRKVKSTAADATPARGWSVVCARVSFDYTFLSTNDMSSSGPEDNVNPEDYKKLFQVGIGSSSFKEEILRAPLGPRTVKVHRVGLFLFSLFPHLNPRLPQSMCGSLKGVARVHGGQRL
jgi:hypothetical protein